MALFEIERLKERIDDAIHENGNKEITGGVLNGTLKDIADTLGQGRTYAGYITPASPEPEHDGLVFYIASEKGTYFSEASQPPQVSNDGFTVVYWNTGIGRWMTKNVTQEKVALAVLSEDEVMNEVVSDETHAILEDEGKLRAVIIEGKTFLFSRTVGRSDEYAGVPEYKNRELTIHEVLIDTEHSVPGGYPYRVRKLTITGVTEE